MCLTSVLKQNANNQHFDILIKYHEFKQVLSIKKLRNHILMQIKVIRQICKSQECTNSFIMTKKKDFRWSPRPIKYRILFFTRFVLLACMVNGYVILLLERYIRVEKKSCSYIALCASSINNLSLAISATFKHTWMIQAKSNGNR